MTPAIREIREAQGARLTRLRTLLELTQAEARERAKVSRHAWSRMEKGEANMDAVALALFCNSLQIPGEYVLSGGLDGLPDHIKRAIIEDELRARLAAGSDSAAALAPAPERTRSQAGKARSVSVGKRAVPVSKATSRG